MLFERKTYCFAIRMIHWTQKIKIVMFILILNDFMFFIPQICCQALGVLTLSIECLKYDLCRRILLSLSSYPYPLILISLFLILILLSLSYPLILYPNLFLLSLSSYPYPLILVLSLSSYPYLPNPYPYPRILFLSFNLIS